MDELFGVSMDYIMLGLLGGLLVSLAAVAYVLLRNRIMFKIGVRNIPRRMAQTVLIVIGLMLSTLIISAALTTGDTVDRSITNFAYELMGHVDEIVLFDAEKTGATPADPFVPQSTLAQLEAALADDPDIAGIVPAVGDPIPVINPRTGLSSPSVFLAGVDPERMDGFPDIISLDGKLLDLAVLSENQVYLNKSAQKELDAQPGDTLQAFIANVPYSFTVVDIVNDRVLTGAVGTDETLRRDGMVTHLDLVQRLLQREDELSFIAISNRGGVRDGMALSATVAHKVEDVLSDINPNLTVEKTKQDAVDMAQLMGNVMSTMFLVMGLFSIAAGVLLIFLIFVMLAAERKPEMGMARAIGTKRSQLIQAFLSEGMAYNLGAALVGAGLGVLVAIGMAHIMASLFAQFDIDITPYVTPRSLIIAYCLGVVVTFITVVISSWRVSRLNIVRAIRDIPEPTYRRARRRTLILGILAALFGVFLAWVGISTRQASPFMLGLSITLLSSAAVLRYLALPERLVFTIVGLAILATWALFSGPSTPLEEPLPDMDYDIEMFFLSGIWMVAAATFVIVYNADILLRFVERTGGWLGRLLPSLRIAVAYPLANKFRTGMTLAMIALVVFAVVVMSIMNTNFNALFLRDDARGGWDIVVQENSNNPVGDLVAALDQEGSVDTSQFEAVGAVRFPDLFIGSDLRQVGVHEEWEFYPVLGVDDAFARQSQIKLQTRARQYPDDQAVWEAIRTTPGLAVIDAFAVSQGGFAGPHQPEFRVRHLDDTAKTMDPITLELRDPASKRTAELSLIGVIDFGSSANFFGLYTSEQTFNDIFGKPKFSRFYVKVGPDVDPGKAAKAIESALVTSGAQAKSLKEQVEEEQTTFNSFFYLIQGFMGMGLLVGTAAVGVIAFRSVVERRQQIGMLRAIGYTRGRVALSFIMESSFVALLGIATGIGLAVLLSFNVLNSDEFANLDMRFIIPWWQIMLTAAFAYGASFVMTILPARQAAAITIAEAIRYE
ncbi:MAG: ABC transporter permease [Dehalococcoidia bacterium]